MQEQICIESSTEVEGGYLCHDDEGFGATKRNGDKRKGNKKKDFCFYCEDFVLNFARHVTRNNSLEQEVRKICALKQKNSEMKTLLAKLRRKGNFLKANDIKKPVRCPQTHAEVIPCSNCMGFFSSKLLWRHRKACLGTGDRRHQANAQNILLRDLRVDPKLRDQVFPRMRPDEISATAK